MDFGTKRQVTAVWQNGGFSAKLNGSSSIELLCKTEHLCFDFRHFAKLQTVIGQAKKPTPLTVPRFSNHL